MADRICLGRPERRMDFLADRTSQNVQPTNSGGMPSVAQYEATFCSQRLELCGVDECCGSEAG